MSKIYLKIILMVVLALVWCIGVCCADVIMDSGHWFVLICMVILPIVLIVLFFRSGRMDDVIEWFEGIKERMKKYL